MHAQSRDPELRLKLLAHSLLEILGVTPEMNTIVIHLCKIGEFAISYNWLSGGWCTSVIPTLHGQEFTVASRPAWTT